MKTLIYTLIFMLFMSTISACAQEDTDIQTDNEAQIEYTPEFNTTAQITHLLDFPKYQKVTPDNIKSVSVIRYTEAGAFEEIIDDEARIVEIYDFLKQIILLGETKYSCTDNTTIYSFTLKDDSKVYIEIECDWIVLNKKHYLFDFTQNEQ